MMKRFIMMVFAIVVAPVSLHAAGQTKIDVCHIEGNGTYHMISIADPAYDAHIEHGDWAVTDEVAGDGLDNNCDGKVDECVYIRLHCDSSSTVLETVCGTGVHILGAVTAANISYVTFLGDTSSVVLNHCVDDSDLSGQSLEIFADTNLCGLEGGCCGDPRWNDEVCSVEIK